MENLAAFSAKESSSSGRRKRGVFLCRRTVRVEAKDKVIRTSFLKLERGTDVRWGGRAENEGELVELVGDQSSSRKALPMSKRGGSKENVNKGAMEKSWHVKVIERMTQSNTSSPQGSEVLFEPKRG